jgi:hypothetical protein
VIRRTSKNLMEKISGNAKAATSQLLAEKRRNGPTCNALGRAAVAFFFLPNLPEESNRSLRWKEAVVAYLLSLDTVANAADFFAGKWDRRLKRNQSRDVLKLLINKFYGACHGHIFKARVRASHAALADTLDLSREWTCTLIGRLRDAGWIETDAPRLPDGKQEVTIFRPGRMLKRLLVLLIESHWNKAHPRSRVNNSRQESPTQQEVVKAKAFLHALKEDLLAQIGRGGGGSPPKGVF